LVRRRRGLDFFHGQPMSTTPQYPDDSTITARSAVDAWLIVVMTGAVVGVLVLAARVIEQAPLQGIGALLLAFIATSVVLMRGFPCYYALTEDALLIRGGIERWRIPYANIESIDRIWSPQGAPAWSARRLKVRHKNGSEQISPINRDEFAAALSDRIQAARADSNVS